MTDEGVTFEEQARFQIDLEKLTQPLVWWWMSFVDNDRPEGDKFVGACIVQAHGVVTAAMQAHDKKCNPGGAVQAVPFPEHVDLSDSGWINRVLTREQCAQFDTWMNETYS